VHPVIDSPTARADNTAYLLVDYPERAGARLRRGFPRR
jgi:hypothetical protein